MGKLRKRSFTYSGNPVTWRDAKKKAKKEGKTFSEVVDSFLEEYNKSAVGASVTVFNNRHAPINNKK